MSSTTGMTFITGHKYGNGPYALKGYRYRNNQVTEVLFPNAYTLGVIIGWCQFRESTESCPVHFGPKGILLT